MFYVQIGAEYYMLLAVALLLIPRNVLHAHSPPSITVFEGRMEIPTSGHHDGGQAGLQRRFGEERTATIDNTEEPLIQYNMLVTGYEPFLTHINPAQEVAELLNGTCNTVYLREPYTFLVCYEGVGLPVSSVGSSWAAQKLEMEPRRWDGVVHLGFESSARGLKLETIAANVKSSERYGYMHNAEVPCQKEGTPFEYIHEDSPRILPNTAPLSYLTLRDLAALLDFSGYGDLVALETWSRDAGAYYCNDQYYRHIRSPARLPNLGMGDMAIVVRFIAESIMLGTIGLSPAPVDV